MRIPAPRRLLTIAVAAALPVGAVAAAVAGPSAGAATGKSVVIRDIAFSPAKLRVSRGATVTFRFRDEGTSHNVRSVGARRFKGSSTKARGTHVVRFSKAGVYRYECTLHPGMKGTITVR